MISVAELYEQFYLFQLFDQGGPVMWPLLALLIGAIALFLERLFYYHRVSINTPEFMKKIRVALEARKIKEAITMCENYKGPIASIMKSGLLKTGHPRQDIETAIAASGGLEMSRMERGLPWLATIASVGPLLGFLGTVTGMIRSFQALADVGLKDPGRVASGISEALITTAFGLIIGIVSLIPYNYFNMRVNKLVLEMEESTGLLMEYVDKLAGPGTSE